MEKSDDYRVKLRIEGTGYRIHPWVHIGRLKPRVTFPNRPTEILELEEEDDWDAALLPEDSWEPDVDADQYELKSILDVRWVKRTRTSRRTREYLVKWAGYSETEWLPATQLTCGQLLYEFDQSAKAKSRFRAMQAGDDAPDTETV